jgi:arginase
LQQVPFDVAPMSHKFAAHISYMSIKYIIVNSEIGAGTRGSSLGFAALEIAAIRDRNKALIKYPRLKVEVNNNALYQSNPTPNAIHIDEIVHQLERNCEAVQSCREEGTFPFIFSADHSNAAGLVSGLKKNLQDKKLGLIWIDAHADLHSPYTTPSGNVHGMPLAALLGYDNKKRKINTPSKQEINAWSKMKEVGAISPKISSDSVILFGVRDCEEPEQSLMHSKGIRNFPVHEIRHRGIETCVNEAVERLHDCDAIYLSFDVDSLDSDLISNGTGTPVSKGFDEKEVIEIINGIAQSGKLAALEFVEINPTLDTRGNRMAEAALHILNGVLPTIEMEIKPEE